MMAPVIHAQGESRHMYADYMSALSDIPCSVPAWVSVITCCNIEGAMLPMQLERNNIGYLNAGFDIPNWTNSLKPGLICKALDISDKPYCLVLDALDVQLNGDFIRAIPEYMAYDKPILFGATRNNSPKMDDGVKDRAQRGAYAYLNAGTAFGPREALSVFYRLVSDIAQGEREQPWVRAVAGRCQSWVDFDWRCRVFQTMG